MLSAGYNLSEANIHFAFGKEYEVKQYNHYPFSAIRFIMPKKGRIKSITGINSAENVDGVYEINMMTHIGKYFDNSTDNSERVGYVVSHGKSREKAIESCNKAIELINVEYE